MSTGFDSLFGQLPILHFPNISVKCTGSRCSPFLSLTPHPFSERGIAKMSVKIDSPCKDCPERHEGCHGKCDGYKAYKAAKQQAREDERKRKDVFKDYCIVRARKNGR